MEINYELLVDDILFDLEDRLNDARNHDDVKAFSIYQGLIDNINEMREERL